MATGRRKLAALEHDLYSCTQEISVIKLSSRGVVDSDICFVDTPSFDDLKRSDLDVLKMISDFLNKTYVILGPVLNSLMVNDQLQEENPPDWFALLPSHIRHSDVWHRIEESTSLRGPLRRKFWYSCSNDYYVGRGR